MYAGTDPLTGRRRWVPKTVRGSCTYTQRELRAFAQVANVAPIVGARTTMAELFERWFSVASVRSATTTARNVRSIIDRQLKPNIGEVLVRELTVVTIDEFYAQLRRRGRSDGSPLSVGTVRRVHTVLHSALAQAMRWEWIWSNPASSACPPRSQPVEVRPPSPAEVVALLTFVQSRDLAFHLFLVLAATTGARRGQLLGLRWSDIDQASGSLLFQRALVDGIDGPVLAPSKNHRCHRAFLDDGTTDLVRRVFRDLSSEQQGRERFVFKSDACGFGRGFRIGSRNDSLIFGPKRASFTSGYTTCATPWPPKCSTPAPLSRSSPSGSSRTGPSGSRPVVVNSGSAILRVVRFGPVRWRRHQCRDHQDAWLLAP